MAATGPGLDRRSLLAAAAAVPLATAAAAAVPSGPDPDAGRFEAWELELHRLQAQGDAIQDEDAAGAVYARAQAIEDAILGARSTSAATARAKLRAMIRYAEVFAEELEPPLRDVLAHLEAPA